MHEWEGREGYMSGRAGRGAQMGGRGRVHEWEGGGGVLKSTSAILDIHLTQHNFYKKLLESIYKGRKSIIIKQKTIRGFSS